MNRFGPTSDTATEPETSESMREGSDSSEMLLSSVATDGTFSVADVAATVCCVRIFNFMIRVKS